MASFSNKQDKGMSPKYVCLPLRELMARMRDSLPPFVMFGLV